MLLMESFLEGSKMTSYFFDMEGSARDEIPPCLVSPLCNLPMLKLDISTYSGGGEILALGCFPALQTFEIQIPRCVKEWEKECTEEECLKLLPKLSHFRRAS